jgi:hypothetical protein
MVGIEDLPTFQARMTFSSARLAVVELGRVLGVKPQVLAETRLTSSDYAQMRAELKDSGMLIVDDEGAEERLIEFRSTYEPFLTGLAEYLLLTLPGWLPSPWCSTIGKIVRVAGLRNVWSMQFRPNRPNAGNRGAF